MIVSVIIPNYNHAPFLKQRIDSVLSQTFQDFELIILDDCSTDDSKKIIENYRSCKKVSHIIYNEKNSGSTFKQWEKGIELAKGEYVWIAESDDWCEPSLLENLVCGLINKLNCILGFCQSYCTDGSEILWINNFQKFTKFCDYQDGREFVNNHMIEGNIIANASMAIWRKSAYVNISKKYTEFKFCGDWLFWIELCLQGEIFITSKVLNYFRKHNLDVSSRVYDSGYNYLEEIKLLDILLEHKVITLEAYLSSLKYRYKNFLKNRSFFNVNRSSEILNFFYKNKEVTKFLIKNDNSLKARILRKINFFLADKR